MGFARINVWITDGDCPCKISNEDWVVAVFDCYGKFLEWCGKKYNSTIARCGHVELELPPGCYVFRAALAAHCDEKKESYKWSTDRAVVNARCDEEQCVTLFAHEYKGKETPEACTVRVDSIKFNHDPLSQAGDALNIRKNFAQAVNVPEWISGLISPEQSPAAYSIHDIGNNIITIKARFTLLPINATSAEVKAVGGGVLGEIDPITVNFVNGVSVPEFVELELNDNEIKNAGVSVRDTEWQWKYRCRGHGKWHNMDKTRHRIYTVLKEPVIPWVQQSYPNNQNPWTDVLDFSCDWAHGASTLDAAAAAVTTKVNQPIGIFEYDMPGGGASHYSGFAITDHFNCTAYIDRLKGGPGNGKFVNCTDCASIVGTFSNILGCELWESKMGWGFDLNEIIAIGLNNWVKPWGNGFSYHEITWKGVAGLSDRIYDACLKVNGNEDDATRRPDPNMKIPELPLNIPFDDPNSFDYREKLVPAASIGTCLPRPSEMTRRAVI